jgi:hypothetical protein
MSARVNGAPLNAARFSVRPILSSENESKSDSGPDGWEPPAPSSWCRYAVAWDHIKANWHLTATPSEWAALTQMAATC